MYRTANREEGTPPMIYRGAAEILGDIYSLAAEADKIKGSLNIRSILLEKLSDEELVSRRVMIPALEAALSEAEEGVARLGEIEGRLSELRRELCERKCARAH